MQEIENEAEAELLLGRHVVFETDSSESDSDSVSSDESSTSPCPCDLHPPQDNFADDCAKLRPCDVMIYFDDDSDDDLPVSVAGSTVASRLFQPDEGPTPSEMAAFMAAHNPCDQEEPALEALRLSMDKGLDRCVMLIVTRTRAPELDAQFYIDEMQYCKQTFLSADASLRALEKVAPSVSNRSAQIEAVRQSLGTDLVDDFILALNIDTLWLTPAHARRLAGARGGRYDRFLKNAGSAYAYYDARR